MATRKTPTAIKYLARVMAVAARKRGEWRRVKNSIMARDNVFSAISGIVM